MNVIQIQVKARKRAKMDLDNFENQGNKGRQYTMTIKEIAQMAGVSSAAVSRYLNGGYVSEQKKEQIRKVIEKTGYQPSTQARILRTGRAHLVGVVAPKINSPVPCGTQSHSGTASQNKCSSAGSQRELNRFFRQEGTRCFLQARIISQRMS